MSISRELVKQIIAHRYKMLWGLKNIAESSACSHHTHIFLIQQVKKARYSKRVWHATIFVYEECLGLYIHKKNSPEE